MSVPSILEITLVTRMTKAALQETWEANFQIMFRQFYSAFSLCGWQTL